MNTATLTQPDAAAASAPPVRITNRAVWEYVLRASDGLIACTGDVVSALVLLSVVRENTAHLDQLGPAAGARPDPAPGRRTASRDPPACSRRAIPAFPRNPA